VLIVDDVTDENGQRKKEGRNERKKQRRRKLNK
jgi:hypothetical protein